MTITVDVDDNDIIIVASPVASRFKGQPLDNLREWMRRQGGFKQRLMSISIPPPQFPGEPE